MVFLDKIIWFIYKSVKRKYPKKTHYDRICVLNESMINYKKSILGFEKVNNNKDELISKLYKSNKDIENVFNNLNIEETQVRQELENKTLLLENLKRSYDNSLKYIIILEDIINNKDYEGDKDLISLGGICDYNKISEYDILKVFDAMINYKE